MQIPYCIFPKYRFRIFKDEIRGYSKQQIYNFYPQKELLEIIALNVQEDHIHLLMFIVPKYFLSSLMGYETWKLSWKMFQR